MNIKVIAIVAVVLFVALATAPVSGQFSTPDQDCIDAGKWHRQQALKWSLRADQEYHLLAARASDELADSGGNCDDWRPDRGAPKYENGVPVNP